MRHHHARCILLPLARSPSLRPEWQARVEPVPIPRRRWQGSKRHPTTGRVPWLLALLILLVQLRAAAHLLLLPA